MREMKDSGVEWIGEIPAHWSPIRFRFIAKITTGNQDTQNADPDGEYPFYVRSPIVERCNNYTFDGKGILMAGDGAGAGRVFHLVDGKYAVHQRVYRFYDFKYMDPVLLKYYLENLFATVMDYGSAKTTVPSVRLPMIQDFVVCVPPKKEQDNIVAVLNEKCAQVGSLISNVQAQIEKLEAYKQSLITEVVTKGLDPTVPMKDSGVEWIGNIPAHWTANKIIRCFGVIGSGTTPTSADDALFEGDINWIQSGDINGSVLSETRFQITRDIVEETSALKVYSAPFIVIAMYGASIGNLSISQIDACTNQACCVLSKPVNGLLLEYLFYAFKPAKDYLIWRADGGGQPNISQEKLKSLWIPIPPNEDQVVIVQHLNKKCGQIDYLIALKQSKIEKLEQYKRSLIYEYVTGKREVS